jgi:hypothetical protein
MLPCFQHGPASMNFERCYSTTRCGRQALSTGDIGCCEQDGNRLRKGMILFFTSTVKRRHIEIGNFMKSYG